MNISDIRIRKVENDENKLRGIASITIDDCFVIHDIKIIEGQDKFFLAMPSKRLADGTYRDIVHPINQEMRELLETSILEVYHNERSNTTEK